jgi:MFS family permease
MSLGLFVFGFNQGIFNVLKLTLLQLHGFSGAIQLALYRGVMTASNPIGGLIGNLFSHYFLKKVGKIRHVAIITDAVSTAMVFLECGSNNLWVIIVGRLFLGICGGINTAICPIYTREFSPIEMVSRTGFIG